MKQDSLTSPKRAISAIAIPICMGLHTTVHKGPCDVLRTANRCVVSASDGPHAAAALSGATVPTVLTVIEQGSALLVHGDARWEHGEEGGAALPCASHHGDSWVHAESACDSAKLTVTTVGTATRSTGTSPARCSSAATVHAGAVRRCHGAGKNLRPAASTLAAKSSGVSWSPWLQVAPFSEHAVVR